MAVVGTTDPGAAATIRYPGRKLVDDRAALAGLLYVLRFAVPWADLPASLPVSGATCWWRLADGRLLRHLIDTVALLHERGIGFRSLQEQIDTTTSGGKLVFHVFGALAEFERDLIRERTQAGLTAARARGRLGGRPRVLNPRDVHVAQQLYHDKGNSIADICRTLRISRATLYRYIKTGTAEPT